jgi:hypothetical protein
LTFLIVKLTTKIAADVEHLGRSLIAVALRLDTENCSKPSISTFWALVAPMRSPRINVHRTPGAIKYLLVPSVELIPKSLKPVVRELDSEIAKRNPEWFPEPYGAYPRRVKIGDSACGIPYALVGIVGSPPPWS